MHIYIYILCRNSYVYTGARGRRPRSQRRQTVDQVIWESRWAPGYTTQTPEVAGSVWVRRRKNEDAIDCPFRRPPPGAQLKYSHRCLSSVLFKRRRPSPWNTCTTGAPSSSGRRRLRSVHQDRAISSTFLSDKSIRFKQLYIQIFEFRPLEFLKKLSPSPSYRFPCSQLAAPSENSLS